MAHLRVAGVVLMLIGLVGCGETGHDPQPDPRQTIVEAIDWSSPGLEAGRDALQAGDIEGAISTLLKHYRERDWDPRFWADWQPWSESVRARADDVLNDRFSIQGVTGTQPRDANGTLLWDHRGPRNDPEWSWLLNRHLHFRDLVAAYQATGKQQYLQRIEDHMLDWTRANPYPGRRSFSHAWRPLEVARRMEGPWPEAFATLQSSPHTSTGASLALLASVPDHADALMRFHAFHGNHRLTEMVMLAQIALVWPEFKDAPEWLAYATGQVKDLFLRQVYPDGVYDELSNHYQRVAVVSFQRFLDLMEAAGRGREVQDLRAGVEQMWDTFAATIRPNGMGPLNNDSDLENNRHWLATALPFYQREDWRFLVTGGAEGSPPADPPSRFLPYAGQAIMRDRWHQTGQWAYFEMGPEGTDHQHRDRLHLSIDLGQRPMLVDSGRYTYLPGPLRDYFTGSRGHNVITLDGDDPLPEVPRAGPEPLPVTARIDDQADHFSASVYWPAQPLEGRGQRRHNRTVDYQRGQHWVVTDQIMVFGPTLVEIRWLIHPEREVEVHGSDLRIGVEGPSALHLQADPSITWELQVVKGQEHPEVAGWYSPRYNIRLPAPQAIYQTWITGPTTFRWHLVPAEPSENPRTSPTSGVR